MHRSYSYFINSLRKTGGVVNTAIVVGAAHGVVSVHSPSLFCEHGGHIISSSCKRRLYVSLILPHLVLFSSLEAKRH